MRHTPHLSLLRLQEKDKVDGPVTSQAKGSVSILHIFRTVSNLSSPGGTFRGFLVKAPHQKHDFPFIFPFPYSSLSKIRTVLGGLGTEALWGWGFCFQGWGTISLPLSP